MGGPAPKLTAEIISQFKEEMAKFKLDVFVVHCPYFINFGSKEPRIFHGSVSVVTEELKRADSLGAKYVMTHLGSAKDLGQEKAFTQAKKGLADILKKYDGKAEFLLEIAAGSGEVIGDTFEELAELMEPLVKSKNFGGICFDTQHAFSSGYDIRTPETVTETFKKFDKIIGLKWLKMSHINDSKVDLGGKKDRHDHIGDGKIGEKGFLALLEFFKKKKLDLPLILETEHDKVEADIEKLKKLRNKI
jgi:deoxyribonuclease-4